VHDSSDDHISELAKVVMRNETALHCGISTLEGYRKPLKQEHGLPGVFGKGHKPLHQFPCIDFPQQNP